MIEVFRTDQCPFSDRLVERLQELVLAHQVHILPYDTGGKQLPFVKEGKRTYRTKAEIQDFMQEIGHEMIVQREMQSDSCKIDPDTGKGCL